MKEEIKNFNYEEVVEQINSSNFVNEYGNKKYRTLDAILLNRSDIVKLLFEHKYYFPFNSCKVAIEVGNLDMVKLLFLYIRNIDRENLIDLAIEYGHLEIVKWLIQFDIYKSCNSKIIYIAAKKGHLDILKFLYLNGYNGKLEKILSFASSNGHIDIIKWLHCITNDKDWSAIDLYDSIIGSCFFGKLEVVKWFYTNYKKFFTPEAIDFAIEGNNYDIVEFLYKNKLPYTHSAIEFACINGNLQILSLIYDQTKCVTMKSINYAAEKGHIDIIIFLHSKGKKCNENTLIIACENGKTNVVKWIYFNYGDKIPSKYYKIGLEKAKEMGHDDIVNFLDKI